MRLALLSSLSTSINGRTVTLGSLSQITLLYGAEDKSGNKFQTLYSLLSIVDKESFSNHPRPGLVIYSKEIKERFYV